MLLTNRYRVQIELKTRQQYRDCVGGVSVLKSVSKP